MIKEMGFFLYIKKEENSGGIEPNNDNKERVEPNNDFVDHFDHSSEDWENHQVVERSMEQYYHGKHKNCFDPGLCTNVSLCSHKDQDYYGVA